MSAISNITINQAITGNGWKLSPAMNGVLNTDYGLATLAPVGIDKNNVAKYRQSQQVPIADAITASFSNTVTGRKVATRAIVMIPATVTENGVSVKKPIAVEIRMTSDIGHSYIDKTTGFNAMTDIIYAFTQDILNGSSVY